MKERLDRQKAFFASDEPGDLLIYYRRATYKGPCIPEILELRFFDPLSRTPIETLCDQHEIKRLVGDFLQIFGRSLAEFYAVDHDGLPTNNVYFGIGAVTAAMTGEQVRFISQTSWCEPAYDDWETIERLAFDPQNPWIRFSIGVCRALLEHWDEDFMILPYLYRSPLDAASGIRGSRLFTDLYDCPEKAKRLIDWCADWSIQLERHMDEQVPLPRGWGRGIWSTWLPAGAVFINGDPVDLISRKLQPIFDRPYTEKLFMATGGGFYHHHSLGLHQVAQVAETRGMLIQEIYDDPNTPSVAGTMIEDAGVRNRVLEASLRAPIMLDDFSPDLLDRLLPILKEGRFILRPTVGSKHDAIEVVKKVRRISNIA